MNPANRELEHALHTLKPKSGTGNRDRLMYNLGRRKASFQLNGWRALSMILLVGVILPWTVTNRPSQKPTDREYAESVDSVNPVETVETSPTSPRRFSYVDTDSPYLAMRESVLNLGLQGIAEKPLPLQTSYKVPTILNSMERPAGDATPTPWKNLLNRFTQKGQKI